MKKIVYLIDGQPQGEIINLPASKLRKLGTGSSGGGNAVSNAMNVKGYVDNVSDLNNIVNPNYGDVYIVVNADNAWWVYVKDYNNIPNNDKWIDSGMKIDLSLYALKTWVEDGFIPKTMQGTFLTTSSLVGYATQKWVMDQGYLSQSSLDFALDSYVTNNTLTSQYYKKTESDLRYLLKSGFEGTGNRLIQAKADGTLEPVTVGSLPPDKVIGYDTLNRVTAFQAKAFKSTWVDSEAPTLSDLNLLGTEIVDAPNVGTGRIYFLCDTIWTYINVTKVI